MGKMRIVASSVNRVTVELRMSRSNKMRYKLRTVLFSTLFSFSTWRNNSGGTIILSYTDQNQKQRPVRMRVVSISVIFSLLVLKFIFIKRLLNVYKFISALRKIFNFNFLLSRVCMHYWICSDTINIIFIVIRLSIIIVKVRHRIH